MRDNLLRFELAFGFDSAWMDSEEAETGSLPSQMPPIEVSITTLFAPDLQVSVKVLEINAVGS